MTFDDEAITNMSSIEFDTPMEVTVSFEVSEDMYDEYDEETYGSADKQLVTAAATVLVESELTVDFAPADKAMTLDEAKAVTDWSSVFGEATAVQGADNVEVTVETDFEFDGTQGIFPVTLNVMKDGEDIPVDTKTVNLFVIDTDGGLLAHDEAMELFAIYNHKELPLDEVGEDIEDLLEGNIDRVYKVVETATVARSGATLEFAEVENPVVEFHADHIEALQNATEAKEYGVDLGISVGNDNGIAPTAVGNHPIQSTMNVTLTATEPTDPDPIPGPGTGDDDLTTGAENVDGPDTGGKNLPSTGEQLSNAGLFGAGLLGLGGLAAWLRKRRKSSK